MRRTHRAGLCATAVAIGTALTTVAHAKDFVVAVSPHIASEDARRTIGRSVVEFLFGPHLGLGESVVVINASDQSQIARFEIPKHPQYNNKASRQKHLEKPIAEFTRFMAKAPETAALSGAINVPKLLEEVAATVPESSEPNKLEVVLVGNPIHVDLAQPRFSMAGGRVPSDAHLTAGIEESVFGLHGGRRLQGVRIHWATLGADWNGDLHELRVRRMWAAYIELRGGQLAAFKTDVRSVFSQLGASGSVHVRVEPELDRGDRKLSMHLVRRDEENRAVEPLFESQDVRRAPVSATPAKLRIGIRWQCGSRCDIDLYAKTADAKKWIYFGESETPEGRFYKYDIDPSKPSKGFEYIEFKGAVDLGKLLIAVNFYEGEVPGGPQGQLRLDLGGIIHEVDFHIQSPRGNKAIGFPDRMGRHAAWVLLNAADIVAGKLKFVGSAP